MNLLNQLDQKVNTTVDVKAVKAAEKAAAKAAKDAEKAAEKEAAKAAKLAEKESSVVATKVERRIQNGVKEKTPGTSGGRIWELASATTDYLQRTVSIAEMVTACENHNSGNGKINLPSWDGFVVNLGDVRTKYNQWRKFHGLAGVSIANPAKEAEKAAKLAEKEAAKAAKAAEKAAAKLSAEQAVAQAKANVAAQAVA